MLCNNTHTLLNGYTYFFTGRKWAPNSVMYVPNSVLYLGSQTSGTFSYKQNLLIDTCVWYTVPRHIISALELLERGINTRDLNLLDRIKWVRTWCRMCEFGMKMCEACWTDGQVSFDVFSNGKRAYMEHQMWQITNWFIVTCCNCMEPAITQLPYKKPSPGLYSILFLQYELFTFWSESHSYPARTM